MARKLQYHVTVEDSDGELKTFGPDDSLPAWAAKKITNPSAWADGDASSEAADDSGDGGDEPKYTDLKKPDLEALVAQRNEGREDDDLIVVGGTGTKADIVSALEADDEKSAAAADA